jgi:hypothetical protein
MGMPDNFREMSEEIQLIMQDDLICQKYTKELTQIAKAFYQAYRITGTVKMKFGVRSIADSDGNSVVDVYISPRDQEAASSLKPDENARHMQFLESMVPAGILGYQFILQIIPQGTSDIQLESIQSVPPVIS